MKPFNVNRIPGAMTGVEFRAGCLFHAQSSFLLPNNTKPSRRRLLTQRAVKAAGY
jgi:hypothetical protein